MLSFFSIPVLRKPATFFRLFFVVFLLAGSTTYAINDGTIDSSFLPSPQRTSTATTLVSQPDGKIIVGGSFNVAAGVRSSTVTRLNPDGSYDSTFRPPLITGTVEGTVFCLALQADGRILVGGAIRVVHGQQITYGLIRLNADGSVDETFAVGTGTESGQSVLSFLIQPDGSIIVGGDFDHFNGSFRFGLAKLSSTGALDPNYNPIVQMQGSVRRVLALKSFPNGRTCVVGRFDQIGSLPRTSIALLDGDGIVDTSFNASIGTSVPSVSDVEPTGDGKLLIVGSFSQVSGVARSRIAKLNADGSLDLTFAASLGFINSLPKILIDGNGKIVLTGDIVRIGSTTLNGIARLDSDGTLDSTFGATFAGGFTYDCVAGSSLYCVGSFEKVNSQDRFGVVRLTASGSVDSAYNSSIGLQGRVYKTSVQGDGKTTAVGDFSHVGNAQRRCISRFNLDGSLDLGFDPGTGPETLPGGAPEIRDIAISAESKIAVSGKFVTFSGQPAKGIALLDSSGQIIPGFRAPLAIGDGITRAVFSGNKIIVIGGFQFENQSVFENIARLNSDGSRDTSFNPLIGGGEVKDAFSMPGGRLLIVGSFQTVGGVSRKSLALLNSDGSLSDEVSLNLMGYLGASLSRLDVLSSGKILVAGYITGVDGRVLSVMRLGSNGVRDIQFNQEVTNLISWDSDLFAANSGGEVYVPMNVGIGSGVTGRVVVRLQENGQVDQTFGNGSIGIQPSYLFSSISIQPDSNLIIAGDFASYNNLDTSALARLNNSSLLNVSGRVTTSSGQVLRNVVVSLIDTTGIRTITTTSSFGIYSFSNVRPGRPYTITVTSKRYRFAPRSIQIFENVTGIDLPGLE